MSSNSQCIDASTIQSKFLESEFEEVENSWAEFGKTHARLTPQCAFEQGKYLGVLSLFLHHDTGLTESYFKHVLRFDPMTDLWPLKLPVDLQAFWDKSQIEYLSAHGIVRSKENIWATAWLPPVMYPASSDPEIRKLQSLYNEQRRKYALAGDNGSYLSILKSIEDQPDPAMIPFRSEVKLRAGMSIDEVISELDKFSPAFISQIIQPYEMYFWVDRVYKKAKEEEQSRTKAKEPELAKPIKSRIVIRKSKNKQ